MPETNKATEATETTKPVKVEMPAKNGVTQPKAGTSCAAIWDHATAMSSEIGSPVAVGDLMAKLTAEGFNESTIKTQYARWRKFHGVNGRIESEAAKAKTKEREEAKAKRAADKEAKRLEREAEKQKKAEAKAQEKAKKEEERKLKAEEKAAEKAAKEASKAEKEEPSA